MRILAIDVTSPQGSLAIRADGETRATLDLVSPEGFGHVLFPAIEAVLSQAGLTLHDIDCFAAANGPGAFTGVRVGLAAAKGLAESCHKPVAGISNLQAVSRFGTAPTRAVALDARRGEIFGALYDANGVRRAEECVSKLDAWLASLPPGVEFLTQTPGLLPAYTIAPTSLAAAVAECAELQPWITAAQLEANYVRRSDAEMCWKDT